MKKQTESSPTESVQSPDRAQEINQILEPINGALESVRAEVSSLASARKTHEDQIAGLSKQRYDLLQKIEDLKSYELDTDSDATELSLEISASKQGLELLSRRLAATQKGLPADDILKTVWRSFDAEFYALKGRIVDLHYHQACIDLAKICELPSEYYKDQEVKFECAWCHQAGSVHASVPTGAGIVFKAHTVRRAECLSLRNRQPTEGFVEIAAEGLRDIRAELELIDDLAKLPSYEPPVISIPTVKVVSKPVSMPKPQRGVDARPPDFKTALQPMGRGMLDQVVASEERNRQQFEKWKEDGILPADAGSHQLQVNAYIPKK